jgi:hypothetical protein
LDVLAKLNGLLRRGVVVGQLAVYGAVVDGEVGGNLWSELLNRPRIEGPAIAEPIFLQEFLNPGKLGSAAEAVKSRLTDISM